MRMNVCSNAVEAEEEEAKQAAAMLMLFLELSRLVIQHDESCSSLGLLCKSTVDMTRNCTGRVGRCL